METAILQCHRGAVGAVSVLEPYTRIGCAGCRLEVSNSNLTDHARRVAGVQDSNQPTLRAVNAISCPVHGDIADVDRTGEARISCYQCEESYSKRRRYRNQPGSRDRYHYIIRVSA